MDLTTSRRSLDLQAKLGEFLEQRVRPNERTYRDEIAASGDPHAIPPILGILQAEAKELGLWNLFLSHRTRWNEPFTNLDYAPIAEMTGSSFLAPEVLNCSPPDAGNMELLAQYGNSSQQERWLVPLLEGRSRSCFAMTEPDVASSDATNIELEIRRDGDDYVLNGRKWWITGAADPRCEVAFVLGRSGGGTDRHKQHSIILVPMDTNGLTVVRDLTAFGYTDREGHCELSFDNVRVPRANLLGEEGGGFAVAQSRLGPGRIHHCMRQIGVAELALKLMCERVVSRSVRGRPLAEQGVIQEWIARSRIDIEQARLLTLKTAWRIDTEGAKAARTDIAAIKVEVLRTTQRVVDWSIQAHGAAGVGPDFPLAEMASIVRWLRIGDGPDEVHLNAIARAELSKYR